MQQRYSNEFVAKDRTNVVDVLQKRLFSVEHIPRQGDSFAQTTENPPNNSIDNYLGTTSSNIHSSRLVDAKDSVVVGSAIHSVVTQERLDWAGPSYIETSQDTDNQVERLPVIVNQSEIFNQGSMGVRSGSPAVDEDGGSLTANTQMSTIHDAQAMPSMFAF